MAITYTGTTATFRTSGSALTHQHLLTLQNSGSDVIVRVKRLVVQLDATAVLTAVMPLVRTSRMTWQDGGTILPKGSFDSTQTSAATVIAKGAQNADGGLTPALFRSPITASIGDIVWQQYCMRLHTLAGQVLGLDNSVLPTLVENTPFVLRAFEGISVYVSASAATSNPITNQWFVQCVWEEETP